MAGIKGRSGGARPGAGAKRKIKTVSEKTKSNYTKAAAKIAKEKGMTIEEHLLRMLFDDDIQDTVKASIMKSYNDAMISREVKSGLRNLSFSSCSPHGSNFMRVSASTTRLLNFSLIDWFTTATKPSNSARIPTGSLCNTRVTLLIHLKSQFLQAVDY